MLVLYLVVFLNFFAKSSPIISGLVAKNWPSFMNVVPIPCKAKQSFSPGFLLLSKIFELDPKEIILKKKFKLVGKVWISLIVLTAPEVDNFLAILNSLKLF